MLRKWQRVVLTVWLQPLKQVVLGREGESMDITRLLCERRWYQLDALSIQKTGL
jgi:hypothetical protein